MKSRSWLTNRIAPGQLCRCCSSHATDSTSRWLVGSSSTSRSGADSISRASATRMRHPPDRSWTGRSPSELANPRPSRIRRASDVDPVAPEGLETMLGLAVGLQRMLVGVGVGIAATGGGGGHIDGQPVQLFLEVRDVGGASQDLLDHRAVDLFGELLGQVADAGVAGRRAPRRRRPAGSRR